MDARLRIVLWTESARSDLDEAIAYVGRRSPVAAFRLLNDILERASSLNMLSERGRIIPELNDTSLREVIVGNYRLMYRLSPGEISIVAFLHGARDFATWQRDEPRPDL